MRPTSRLDRLGRTCTGTPVVAARLIILGGRWLPSCGSRHRGRGARGGAHDGVCNLVEAWGRRRRCCTLGRTSGRPSVAGRERLLAVGPTADDDIAGKQALVLATSLLLFEWVRLSGAGVLIEHRRRRRNGIRLGLLPASLVEDAEAVLIIAEAVRIRRRGLTRWRCRRPHRRLPSARH